MQYQIRTIHGKTGEIKLIKYLFEDAGAALEVAKTMASGGVNQYQVFKISTGETVYSLFGKYYRGKENHSSPSPNDSSTIFH